ncbi:MAG: hypothetical protein DWQ49_13740 [Bacteroidetes bacterium]|nr:MAG: hypothetical protein DWQ49_13740 [Bacteroidota bacterium]
MGDSAKSQLDSILKSVVSRDSTGPADTMLVSAHLSQMKMFGIRQGVEFYPMQDNFGTQRYDFIQQVIKFNRLDARLDSIWDRFLAYGKGLFYIRPTEKTYRIYWFDRDSYRTYYSPEGDLEEVIIIYPYKVKTSKGFSGVGLNTNKRYMRLRITAEEIEEYHSEQEISFDNEAMDFPFTDKKVVKNSMEFIPCVEVLNNPDAFGTEGAGEFDMMANQIIAHDEMVKNIRANLSFFGNPTLLSSRPKQDIVEHDASDPAQRPSISSQSGFQSEFFLSSSTFKQDNVTRESPGYNGKPGSGMRVPRVIANLEPTDRVGFITPNAVSTDQARFAEQLRSEIRLALGGIDDLSITNVTATEYKSAYGRVSATAKKKCLQLYTYGINRCLELIIFQEEQIFRKSMAYESGIKYPVLPEEPDEKALEKYERAKARYEKKLQAAIDAAIENQELPPGVLGLAPDGDRTVMWRWLGPVYEDTTQDKLNQSIFTRNLQELGVDSIEALKYLFPSKTDDEIAGMLSGFPFRVVGEVQRAYSAFIDLINQEMRTPHPQQPNLPMAADPRLDLTPFLYRTLESLQKEVTYAGRYRNADPIGTPSIPDPTDQLRGSGSADGGAGSGGFNQQPMGGAIPAGDGPSPANAGPDGSPDAGLNPYSVRAPGVPGDPTSGEPLPGGIQQGGRAPEFARPIPNPGSTIDSDPSNRPGQLRFPTGSPIQQPGDADLFAFDQQQPGILQQLFPNFAGNYAGPAPSQRSKRSKS